MPLVEHVATVRAPIDDLWHFLSDPVRNLPRISPPTSAVVVESADLPLREGSVIVVAFRDPLNRRMRSELRIDEYIAPHPVPFGIEARFVDRQISGPFRQWTHWHELEALDSQTTRLVDRIQYRLPYGLLGTLANWLLVRWLIGRQLRHRVRRIKELLEV